MRGEFWKNALSWLKGMEETIIELISCFERIAVRLILAIVLIISLWALIKNHL